MTGFRLQTTTLSVVAAAVAICLSGPALAADPAVPAAAASETASRRIRSEPGFFVPVLYSGNEDLNLQAAGGNAVAIFAEVPAAAQHAASFQLWQPLFIGLVFGGFGLQLVAFAYAVVEFVNSSGSGPYVGAIVISAVGWAAVFAGAGFGIAGYVALSKALSEYNAAIDRKPPTSSEAGQNPGIAFRNVHGLSLSFRF